jgi:hypothetical protein
MYNALIAKKDRDYLLNVHCGDCAGENESNPQIVPVRGYLEKYFSWLDVQAAVKLLIGLIPKDAMVNLISLDIFDNFDNNLTENFHIKVGDDVTDYRLMNVEQNDPTVDEERYHSFPDYRYLANTNLYLYFSNQLPSTGHGRVVVYFN